MYGAVRWWIASCSLPPPPRGGRGAVEGRGGSGLRPRFCIPLPYQIAQIVDYQGRVDRIVR